MAAIRGRCAECFKVVPKGEGIEGQESHKPAIFCSEGHRALHGRAWASCVKSAIREEAKVDAVDLFFDFKRGRWKKPTEAIEAWVEAETEKNIKAHLEYFRPDLIRYVGYGKGL